MVADAAPRATTSRDLGDGLVRQRLDFMVRLAGIEPATPGLEVLGPDHQLYYSFRTVRLLRRRERRCARLRLSAPWCGPLVTGPVTVVN
jgi:hypothetical protein